VITAAYRELWRVHGLFVTEDNIHLHLANLASAGQTAAHAQVQCFATAPNFPVQRVPRFAVVGRPQVFGYANPLANDPTFHGSWFMVTVVGNYSLNPAIEDRFNGDPPATASETLSAVSGVVTSDGAQWCAIIAATLALQLKSPRFEHLAAFVGLLSPPGFETWTGQFRLRVLPELQADQQLLLASIAARAAFSAVRATVRKQLSLAFHWFLRGREEPEGSTDRFLWLFLALEAAINAATKDEVSTAQRQQFEALVELARRNSADLEPFVARLQSRLAQPFLSDRFTSLSAHFFPDCADADQDRFRRLSRIRNILLHGRARDLRVEDEPADSVLEQLTIRYLDKLSENVAALPLKE
jgi:hypothetical protein